MRGGAGVRGGAVATGGSEVRRAGVCGETARVRLHERAGASGWAVVRGGVGVRVGAEGRFLLVSWLPSLASDC